MKKTEVREDVFVQGNVFFLIFLTAQLHTSLFHAENLMVVLEFELVQIES